MNDHVTARHEKLSLLVALLSITLLSETACAVNLRATPSLTVPAPTATVTPSPTAPLTATSTATAAFTPTHTLTTTPTEPPPTATKVKVEPSATENLLATLMAKLEEPILTQLYEQINPAVVSITMRNESGNTSHGSGFVFDEEGRVITNHHVVRGSQSIEVTFSNGERVHGQVIGSEITADLAIVQVERLPEGAIPVVLGDSDQVLIGQRVVAIGNPFGLDGTMTSGIVSGLGRTLQSEIEPDSSSNAAIFSAPDIIQTDAAINRGNSGGPLINLDGEVIGVNKAIYSESGSNSGVGFAISSNMVKRIVPSLIADGRYEYPYLGITSVDDITLAEIDALKLPQSMGVYVMHVDSSGPAAAAGLLGGTVPTQIDSLLGGGDLIIAIDEVPMREFADLLSYLVNHAQVGQVVRLTVVRSGEQIQIDVTLAQRPY